MEIIWSIVWAVMTPLVMVLTIKYYLPKLAMRIQRSGSEASQSQNQTGAEVDERRSAPVVLHSKNDQQKSFVYKTIPCVIFLIIAAAFSMWCGYCAATSATSTISMMRMTTTFVVLACVFITDLELYIIPNMCSVLLLAGRLLLIICEYIWQRDSVMSSVVESVLTVLICLVLLIVVSAITHGGIGMGDVKLFSSLGFMCGLRSVCFTLIIAFVLCALYSMLLLILKKKHLKDTLPLGPFITIAFGICILLALI